MNGNGKQRDFELIERFKAGDDRAFELLVEAYASKAYQIAYGLLGNKQDAEEVVQDAFLKAYKKLVDFRGDSSFSTWFYRILTNLSRNKYHWNRRRGAGVNMSMSNRDPDSDVKSEMEIPDKKLNPSVLMQRKETGSELTRSVGELPENLREVLILRHANDMSYAEIASMLGCELGTVKSRLARAREALRKIFYDESSGQGAEK